MIVRKVRRFIGLSILLPSLVIWLWGVWPASQTTRSVRVHLPVPDASNNGSVVDRDLLLTWPVRLRVGDTGLIRLSLEGNNKSREVAENQPNLLSGTTMTGSHSNQTRTGNVLAEGRLELSGMLSIPSGEVFEPLGAGERAVFFWKARPDHAGKFDGFIWLHLNSIIPGGSQEGVPAVQNRSLLSAQRIEMEVDDLFGLDGSTARLLGVVGIAIGSIMLLDSWFLKILNKLPKENNISHA